MVKEPAIGKLSIRANRFKDVAGVIGENETATLERVAGRWQVWLIEGASQAAFPEGERHPKTGRIGVQGLTITA
jgi:hypothetical protein